MKQIKIPNNFFIPMPVLLAGTVVDGKENFMAVGWCSRVNSTPPMIAMGIHKSHHTPKGIITNQTFSLCMPNSSQVVEYDYCGIASGKDVDKSSLFKTFYGELETAPMIEDYPINLECKLIQTIELPSNYLFIGEIVDAYALESVVQDGKAIMEKIDPMILTMRDNTYWNLTNVVGKAWGDGKKLIKE